MKEGRGMRKSFFVCLAALLLAAVALVPRGFCQQKATPQYGGVLRILAPSGPQMLSYVPMMGPGDHAQVFPAGERLIDTLADRHKGSGYEPVLAEKVDEDVKGLKLTWHIRRGVKFQDGSD